MRITDVLHNTTEYDVLLSECSQFIEESHGCMLFRALPNSYSDIHKVKVRKKKSGDLDQIFNEAFDEQYPQLRQRAILTYGEPQPITENTEPFFVFPIDGYKFMYSPNVTDSQTDHQRAFASILENVNGNQGVEMIADMLKFTYVHDQLVEGITSGAEIVLYNTPYYYAVRATQSSVDTLTTMRIL